MISINRHSDKASTRSLSQDNHLYKLSTHTGSQERNLQICYE